MFIQFRDNIDTGAMVVSMISYSVLAEKLNSFLQIRANEYLEEIKLTEHGWTIVFGKINYPKLSENILIDNKVKFLNYNNNQDAWRHSFGFNYIDLETILNELCILQRNECITQIEMAKYGIAVHFGNPNKSNRLVREVAREFNQ